MTTTISTTATFESMDLHPNILKAIKANGYVNSTEIQSAAIPSAILGKDLIAAAETGSGKTDAFVIPSLHRLIMSPPKGAGIGPRVLILTPTRELAGQITESINKMCKFTNFRFGTITGGVPYYSQEQLLRRPFDILVATPGRLMDHMERGRVDFRRLEIFVLDEADRMLDMGFVNDMEQIAAKLPEEHQTLLFSATFDGNIQKIARKFLKDPVQIQLVSATKKHTLITQRIHIVDDFHHKRSLLNHVLQEAGMWQAIVFTGTKRSADELADDLSRQGIECAALHGDMKQSRRSRTLERMHRGQLRVLVATDVAARGLDVKKLSHVINFDMPRTAEDYVHRIGRTGRCGEKGIAVSLVGPKDSGLLAQIERFTGQRLERHTVEGLEPKRRSESNNHSPSRSKPKPGQGNRARFGKPSGERGFNASRRSGSAPKKGGFASRSRTQEGRGNR